MLDTRPLTATVLFTGFHSPLEGLFGRSGICTQSHHDVVVDVLFAMGDPGLEIRFTIFPQRGLDLIVPVDHPQVGNPARPDAAQVGVVDVEGEIAGGQLLNQVLLALQVAVDAIQKHRFDVRIVSQATTLIASKLDRFPALQATQSIMRFTDTQEVPQVVKRPEEPQNRMAPVDVSSRGKRTAKFGGCLAVNADMVHAVTFPVCGRFRDAGSDFLELIEALQDLVAVTIALGFVLAAHCLLSLVRGGLTDGGDGVDAASHREKVYCHEPCIG